VKIDGLRRVLTVVAVVAVSGGSSRSPQSDPHRRTTAAGGPSMTSSTPRWRKSSWCRLLRKADSERQDFLSTRSFSWHMTSNAQTRRPLYALIQRSIALRLRVERCSVGIVLSSGCDNEESDKHEQVEGKERRWNADQCHSTHQIFVTRMLCNLSIFQSAKC
jgi:hypothetical protein